MAHTIYSIRTDSGCIETEDHRVAQQHSLAGNRVTAEVRS